MLPGNLTVDDSDAYLTGGTGVPDITAALMALAPYSIFGLIDPLYSADELLEKKNEFADRWAYDVASFGGHFTGVTKETLGDLIGSAKIDDDLKNDWHCCIPAAPRVPWDGVSLAGAYAGACLASLRIDPALGLIPEISGNRLMVSVRLMQVQPGFASVPSTQDTSFELTLCA